MNLFRRSNPYKEKNFDPNYKERVKWGFVFCAAVLAAIGFFGHAASYHPSVNAVYNRLGEKVSLTSLVDRRSSPCKIAVLSYCFGHQCTKFWHRAQLNHAAYAKHHGYDYIAESHNIVDPALGPESSILLAFQKWLPHYDFIFFIEPGSLIMNGDIKLEDQFLLNDELSKDADLFISWESQGPFGDSMLLRGTARMLHTLSQMIHHQGKTQFFPGVGGTVDYFQKKQIFSNVRYLPFRKFQSFGQHKFISPVWENEMKYKEGDFIVRDGGCGFSLTKCHVTEVFDEYYAKLIGGAPHFTTPPSDESECKTITVNVSSFTRSAFSLLRREMSPRNILKNVSVGGK